MKTHSRIVLISVLVITASGITLLDLLITSSMCLTDRSSLQGVAITGPAAAYKKHEVEDIVHFFERNNISQVREDLYENKSTDIYTKHNDSLYEDDLLANISLGDIKHVMEHSQLNKSAFLEWSQKLLLQEKLNTSLYGPEFTIRGENICDNNTQLLILMPAVPGKSQMMYLFPLYIFFKKMKKTGPLFEY